MGSYYEDRIKFRSTVGLKLGDATITHFTLPLIFEDTYFIWESNQSGHVFSVFTVDGSKVKIDFLHNEPINSAGECGLYSPLSLWKKSSKLGVTEYDITLASKIEGRSRISLRHGGQHVCVEVADGYLCTLSHNIVNRNICGIPLGVHLVLSDVPNEPWIDFPWELPVEVSQLLVYSQE